MILLALLTGAIIIIAWSRQVTYFMLFVLCSWGLLAASTPIGARLVDGLNSMSSALDGLFT